MLPFQRRSNYPADSSKNPGYKSKKRVHDRYKIIGFISSGTYGRVYKAEGRNGHVGEFAIKKFKPDKEGEVQYTGISQSAIREMALCTELSHPNVVHTVEIILEDKCIFIVFEYAEHDLLQIIHHHTQATRHPIPARTIKSILHQLLQGLLYIHRSWVMHRDLKPANIMVTSAGSVKIGDLGLARMFYKPLNSLYLGDKVVVTIWYRAPELLLGSRHYTPAVDLWAVGCIFAELLSLRPIFKGEEAKMDSKKTVPFQRNQMQKIVEIMGMPNKEKWPLLASMPEYAQLNGLAQNNPRLHRPVGLENWYNTTLVNNKFPTSVPNGTPGPEGLSLLQALLEYDPQKRLTAEQALQHVYFTTGEKPVENCFEGSTAEYPHRRVSQDDNDIRTSSLPGTKRSGLPDDSIAGRPAKRLKEG
ncbi:cyclin-dependent protein kinase-like protein Ssn3 [Aulographum hederae CBS 113979]|uniref:Serine/threonine-protein kinase SSN3 n=1 Tax=Aulographum hederae CBS 113979 TaxID=1176131 RepID=A0A6G1GQW5_9PEZI|nr:cyclin-dependent protein kinase-like protein Ssn3 [Aulographum hederae CBS 113979]